MTSYGDYHDDKDFKAYNTPRKRKIFTILYLVLFGVVIGIALSGRYFPSKESSDLREYTVVPETNSMSVDDFESTVVTAVQKAMPAVVSIHTSGTERVPYRYRDPFYDMLYGQQEGERAVHGMGSGVIIHPSGIIITNDHVINIADQPHITPEQIRKMQIKVVLTDGRTFDAKFINHFPTQDIAILTIEGESLPYIEIGSSEDVKSGQTTLAIGNPFGTEITGGLAGGQPSVSRGIISATNRNLTINEGKLIRYYRSMIQTDAAINHGNSGGALINLKGKLIGINTAIVSPKNTGSIGIGFAIPSDRVKLILKNVQEYGSVPPPDAGIRVMDLTKETINALKFTGDGGSLINSVEKDGPGDVSGFKRGDVIIKVNGFTVNNSVEVTNIFLGAIPGEVFTITVFRNGGVILDLELKLGSK